jgi:hypothetical protein
MVEIHLYGKLRHYVAQMQPGRGVVVKLEPAPADTIATLLAHIDVPVDEIHHIFHNAKLLATRTTMAPYMGYQQSRANLFDWDLNVPITDGDRIGLFGSDMTMLGM